MTKEEIRNFLDNTKVYVNGKSKEIQEKLFSFGYKWYGNNPTKVYDVNKPFLFIQSDGGINYSSEMLTFKEDENREITAEEILSLEVTEPSYRPFRDNKECWDEMQKHQPIGWLIEKVGESQAIVQSMWDNAIYIRDIPRTYKEVMRMYTFADGTPFGIKEE